MLGSDAFIKRNGFRKSLFVFLTFVGLLLILSVTLINNRTNGTRFTSAVSVNVDQSINRKETLERAFPEHLEKIDKNNQMHNILNLAEKILAGNNKNFSLHENIKELKETKSELINIKRELDIKRIDLQNIESDLKSKKDKLKDTENNLKDVEKKLIDNENELKKLSDTREIKKNESEDTLPVCGDEKLVGSAFIDLSVIKDHKMLEAMHSKVENPTKGTVEMGGLFKPNGCKAKRKTALLIPYRNRWEQLKIFLRYMHPLLQRQQLHYQIFIIEQVDDDMFNRASLLNIGFKEALKFEQFECFVLSDVDFLPADDHNSYGCDTSPKHLITAADRFNNGLPYDSYFGGVSSFTREDFQKINGFSNLFWGWGGEDDDLYARVVSKGLTLHRPGMKKGQYRSILENHHRSNKVDDHRMETLKSSKARQDFDGLNTLVYKLLEVKQEKLYTHVKVKLTKQMYSFQLQQCLHQNL